MPTQKMEKTLFIKTFGCQMNVYDSDRMRSMLAAQGFRKSSDVRSADVIILNTCSIRDKSEQKVLSLLGELKELKKQRPDRVLAVSGCVGQRMGRMLLQRAPQLDLVLGPDQIDRVGELVRGVLESGKRFVEADLDKAGRSYSQPAMIGQTRPSEFLTVMKGCDHFCTYCIVPFVRGWEKSRPIPEILEDVKEFVAKGTKEITFLGQNINSYGKGTGATLAELIERASEISGLERIRYVTSHPRDLGMDLIHQFASVEKLMPALHLPFQSGSSAVLKKMARQYTREQYLEKVDALRNSKPEIALSTDVIVGFPGETDEDFEQTLSLLATLRFSGAFLFKYSPRPGTRANEFGEEVAEVLKEERLRRAQQIAFRGIEEENRRYVGRTVPVLVEALDKKAKYFTGRSPSAKVVHVLNATEDCVGKIIDVEISESTGSSLRGHYVGAPRIDRHTQKTSSPQV